MTGTSMKNQYNANLIFGVQGNLFVCSWIDTNIYNRCLSSDTFTYWRNVELVEKSVVQYNSRQHFSVKTKIARVSGSAFREICLLGDGYIKIATSIAYLAIPSLTGGM